MHALLVIDVQNDFLPGGALAVPHGDEVIPVVLSLMDRFELVVATQDWHPPLHQSFASQHPGRHPGEVIDLHGLPQVLWPDHCVQGSAGADFARAIDPARFDAIFQKGQDPAVDSYSGFFDNGRRHATGLGDWLRGRGVDTVTVLGLATDYCVKWTALDALELGLTTQVVVDGCRGVGLAPGDVERALAELAQRGARLVTASDLAAGARRS